MNVMIIKPRYSIFPFLLFFFTLNISCKRSGIESEPANNGITKQPVGSPIGEKYSEIIGENGGSVKSEDGLIEIKIPAGALMEETEIGIQPLNSTAVSAIGKGYRLTPHGNVFKKKVTIQFNYWKYKNLLSNGQAAEVAFQQEDGQWTCVGGGINDTIQKVISVLTDHFSDWGLIASMELSPVVKTIGLGKTVLLKALRYMYPQQGDDWIVPLTSPGAGTGEPMKIENNYIVDWKLDGPGKLDVSGAEAVYTAPASSPGNSSTATITLELNVHGKQVLLISTIYIISDGINISIDGGEWQTYPGMAVKMPELFRFSMSSLRVESDIPQIVFMWPENKDRRSNGNYSWSMHDEDETDVTFEYDEPDLQFMYVSIFDDGVMTFDSGGVLSIEEMEENGKKYIMGYFDIDEAGMIERGNGQQVKTADIRGTFKVQRNW